MRICNFTPGPWASHKYPKLGGGYAFSIRVKDRPGITIANLSPGNTSDRIEPVCEANAALIAAAPDLLLVAKGCLGYLKALPASGRPDDAWFVPLEAAIKSAEGGK